MSSAENKPDLVEEKKEQIKGMTSEFGKYKEFFTNLTNNVIFKLVVRTIILGTMGLYVAKVAQSNILPDDVDLSPFTDIKRNVSQIPIDINIIKERTFWGVGIWDKPINVYSEKIEFDNDAFLKSFNGSLLCFLKKNANPQNFFGNLCLYFSKVLSETTSNSFWLTNRIFNVYNYLPEWIIMLVSGFYPSIFFGIFFIFNLLGGIIPHLKNLTQFFRKPNWSGNDWEDEGKIHFLRPFKWLIFWFLWFWISLNSMIIMPIYLTFYNFIAPLTAKYKTQGVTKEKHFGTFLLDNIFYKGSFLFTLFSYYLGINAYKYLPKMYSIALIITLSFIFIYKSLFFGSTNTEGTNLTAGLANPKNLQGKVSMGNNDFDVCKKSMEYQEGGKGNNK